MDIIWLKKYESFLRNKGLSENTLGIRFRTLRALYNAAIEENIVKAEHYPFDQFKVLKLSEQTLKRALTKEDVYKVFNQKSYCNTPYSELAIDLFTFSYFMGGINFVDMAYLTESNIIDNTLVYYRKKIKKLIRLPLQHKAREIIETNLKENSLYLFPILTSFHKTEVQQKNRVHKVIGKVNKHLKKIGKDLELPI